MSLAMLKKAILASDWEMAREAYEKLSGKKLPLSKKTKTRLPKATAGKTNRFVDDGTIAQEDMVIDKKLSGSLGVRERRPEFQKVQAKCDGCNQVFEVHPTLAPKRVMKDDEPSYLCDDCIVGKTKSRR